MGSKCTRGAGRRLGDATAMIVERLTPLDLLVGALSARACPPHGIRCGVGAHLLAHSPPAQGPALSWREIWSGRCGWRPGRIRATIVQLMKHPALWRAPTCLLAQYTVARSQWTTSTPEMVQPFGRGQTATSQQTSVPEPDTHGRRCPRHGGNLRAALAVHHHTADIHTGPWCETSTIFLGDVRAPTARVHMCQATRAERYPYLAADHTKARQRSCNCM